MKEYTFTIPDNLQANELLNFILRSKIFNLKTSSHLQNSKKEEQKKMRETDLKEAFEELKQLKSGGKEKKSLKQFLNGL